MAFNKSKAMDAARKYVDRGQMDKAIKEYLRVVQDDPKDVRVWLKIGDLYARKGEKAEATQTYLKVAKFYGEQGFYLKAVAVYKQIVKLDPHLVEVNLKMAELYRQLGLLPDAMHHFEVVAAHFHREGKTKEALATLREIVILAPNNVAARIKLAELYSKEEMNKEAVVEFEAACLFLRENNRQDDFIKVAERLLWHAPERLELSRELATLYLRRNDARRALQKLQACFKADPRDVETLVLLAQAFQALDQKGKTVSVLKELAKILHQSNQRARAEDVHRKILEFVPNDPDSREYLGGKQPAAVEAPRGRVALTTSDIPVVRANPTGSLPLVEDPELPSLDSAIESLDDSADFAADLDFADEQSSRVHSHGGEVHAENIVKILTESEVYVKYRLFPKAIEHLMKIFELDPDNVEAHERLKDVYLAQGREGDALKSLMKLAELTAGAEPARAEGYLREVVALDGTYAGAFELANRFGLNLSVGADIEVLDSSEEFVFNSDELTGGTLAPVDDEIDFNELDFGDSTGDVAGAPDTYGSALDAVDGLEFDLDEAVEAHLAAEDVSGGTGTMEVAIGQVEEMLAVGEGEFDEFSLDAPAAPDHDLDAALEPDFDPDDARAFDADLGRPTQPAEAFASAAPLPEDVPVVPDNDFDEIPGFDPRAAAEFDRERVQAVRASSQTDAHPVAVPEPPPYAVPVAPAADFGATVDAPFAFDDATSEGHFDDGAISLDQEYEEIGDSAIVEVPEPAELAGGAIEDDLDEADFFVSQKLFDEAVEILTNLLKRNPTHPLVKAKLKDVEAMMSAAAGGNGAHVTPIPALDQTSDRGDLDMGDFGLGTDDDVISLDDEDDDPKRPTVLLEKPIDDQDSDTHYDLGQAYKEMGLYGEAIKAFNKVAESATREVQCRLMIGLCHREQGNHSEAIHQFKLGLHGDRLTEAERVSMFYEIGSTYEDIGDPGEALYYFEMITKKDASFRDVTARIAGLRSKGPAADTRRTMAAPDDPDAALDSLLAESDNGG